MGFVLRTIIKMADKMVATYQFASVCWCADSNLVIFNWISFKFHIWFASIKLWFKFEYGFCPTDNNKDGQQKWPPPISLHLWTLYLSHLSPNFFQIPYTFIKHWRMFGYGFCLMNDNQYGQKMAAYSPFALVGTLTYSFITPLHPNFMHDFFINFSPKFKYKFCQIYDNKMAAKIATVCKNGQQNGRLWFICSCGDSNLVIYHLFSSNFHA